MSALSGAAADARHAARMLAKARGFSAIVIVTLALGIGSATAIFTVVNRVLLSPLQYPDSARIVNLVTSFPKTGKVTPRITGGDLVDIRERVDLFEKISSYSGGEVGTQVAGRGEFTDAFWVDPGFFGVFGVQPLNGVLFPDSGAAHTAIASLSFALRNFGSGQAAIGKRIRVENESYEISGVVSGEFRFPEKAELWLAGPSTPANLNRTAYNYRAVAKLRADMPLTQATAALAALGARLEAAYPASNKDKTFNAEPLRERLVGKVRGTLYLLMGAVGLILLIACANVANLLLARTPARSREIAVRVALGANRWRVVRQLTVENLVLATAAGILGAFLAKAGIRALLHAAPADLPRLNEVAMDGWALGFAILASLASVLLFGLAPAWQAARADVNVSLKQSGARGVLGHGSHGLRNGLVVAEIALSFILAMGAGLLFRSFVALTSVPLGYRGEGLAVMYTHAPAHSLNEHLQVGRQFEDLLDRVRAVPGVASAAAAMGLPAGQYGSNGSYRVEGAPPLGLGRAPQAGFRLASPGYFSTLGVPLISGRDFTRADVYDSPGIALVSASLARQTFPNTDPIGKRIQLGLDRPDQWLTITGVVGDVRSQSPASAPEPEIYMPLRQHPFYANEVQVAVRTAVPPASLAPALRAAASAVMPEAAVRFTTMREMLADSIATPRFRALLMSVFASLALLLAMGGVYGVMTYITAERTGELGVRLALGATPANVMALILRQAGLLAAIGLATGLGVSASLGKVLASMLFGLKPTDLATYAGVLAAVSLTTAAAAAWPAWRAGRIDPVRAIRNE